VEIIIDGDKWSLLDAERQVAILDHELCHLELQTDYSGTKRDDLGRPRLKMVHHDHQYGWFDAVVRRHGKASIEAEQVTAFIDNDYQQLWLPFMGTARKSRKKAG